MISIGSKEYVLNDKFYLKNFSTWDEKIRDWLASREKIIMGEEHYLVINFLRNNFAHTNLHPPVRAVAVELKKQYGAEKGSVKYFHTLFTGGVHQAYLLAGIPMVDSCC